MSDHRLDDEDAERGGEDPPSAPDSDGVSRPAFGAPSLKLSELSELADVPPRRVRYFRERGLVTPVGGSGGRGHHARYSLRDALKVRVLHVLDAKEIAHLIDNLNNAADTPLKPGVEIKISERVSLIIKAREFVNFSGDKSTG